jgi:hypothetical protein
VLRVFDDLWFSERSKAARALASYQQARKPLQEPLAQQCQRMVAAAVQIDRQAIASGRRAQLQHQRRAVDALIELGLARPA